MEIDENMFFREVTLRLCSTLDLEIALQKCLRYLKTFMPADCFLLSLYERELGALRVIATVTEVAARRVDILIPVNSTDQHVLKEHLLNSCHITSPHVFPQLSKSIIEMTGLWKEHCGMVLLLKIEGVSVGNVTLFSKGFNRFSEEHLRLFSQLYEPFAIALSNSLRYDELKRLKDNMGADIQYLRQKLIRSKYKVIIGENLGLKRVMEMARRVAPLDSPVLLQGETGTGKEVIANAIHHLSSRKKGPFIQVNCGAIPETLIDSELFGHEKGAFTGAIEKKRGCFELADKGTIFLDEIAELSLQAQIRLLRVLQEKKIKRVGGEKQISVNTRIITASHQNLDRMVERKLFRSDLLFRLNVFPIRIPSLRERKEDIPVLINYFMEKKAKEIMIPQSPKLAKGAIQKLMAYPWPGNVRELENAVERELILCKDGLLYFNDFPLNNESQIQEETIDPQGEFPTLDLVITRHIKKAMKQTNGKIYGPSGTANLLGINHSTLRHRMRKLGIQFGKGLYE